MRIKEIKKAWFCPTEESIDDVGEYLYLGGPGSLMMVIGYLGTDMMVLLAGLIGLREQAVCALLINFETLIF